MVKILTKFYEFLTTKNYKKKLKNTNPCGHTCVVLFKSR